MADYDNSDLDPSQMYYNWAVPLPPAPTIVTNIEGDTTIVTTINGNSGSATGPAITLSGGSTGYVFNASVGSITLAVSNATTVRTSISAAKSGANSDITSFTALTGNTGVSPWTGTASGSGHATYSGTASAAYVQAELQGVMDKLQQTTEFLMFLVAALLAPGVVET
jgi:hypothetical protein